ncbi:MAG TPA: pyridoxine 5'-phosphate synthase [Chromatiales bacterium]|nr:pyridoxine 5'-phosphate synthase [Thiotrichales bacterium]HIP67330.1 pyridoxine 5'-phosphate synthase [Chromatiales bacterium]
MGVGLIKLGVNIDHAATIRQARFTPYPDMVRIVSEAEAGGADGITLHLREDRRHIQDDDVFTLRTKIKSKMNLEMAATDEMVEIACKVKPEDCCLVPEKREELTTEGGLDVLGQQARLTDVCHRLKEAGIEVSIFIEPDLEHITAVAEIAAPVIELHTGTYANTKGEERDQELHRLITAAEYAHNLGLIVNAGHGLDYENIGPILLLPHLNELNIGHSIIARALFVGIRQAVAEMKVCLS